MNRLIKILSFALFVFFFMVVIFSISNGSSWLRLGNVQPETPRFFANTIPAVVKAPILNADSNPPSKVKNLAAELWQPIRSMFPVKINGQGQFGFDLYQAIRSTSGNLVYSPYSISTVMAMAYEGAKGNTEKQMSKTLHFPFLKNPAVNSSDLKISVSTSKEGDNTFKLKVANSLWGQKSYGFRPEFLTTLNKSFDTELQLVDFQSDGGRQEASSAINQWVNQSTEGMIKKIVSQDSLTDDTRLILANAIYFKAEWAKKFVLDPPDVEFKFTLLDGNTVTFPRMSVVERFGYTEGEGYQIVELPYKGNQMTMVIVLPEKGGFESIEKQFNAQFVEQVLSSLKPQMVDLYMPKFKYEAQLSLANTLSDLGMPDAFNYGQANFSGMDGTKELYISQVIHKAVIAVDETGTEAAAVTTIGLVAGCGGNVVRPPIPMRVNRPFLFLRVGRYSGYFRRNLSNMMNYISNLIL